MGGSLEVGGGCVASLEAGKRLVVAMDGQIPKIRTVNFWWGLRHKTYLKLKMIQRWMKKIFLR